MSTRIHTKIATTIAAALVIAAAVAPGTFAGPSKRTRITIPPSLVRLHEPGSTGYLPKTKQVTIPSRLANFREPGSAGYVPNPLTVGYLTGQGLSPSQVSSWTVGACSHQVKAASCYAMLERTSFALTPSPPAIQRRGAGDFPTTGRIRAVPKVDPLAVGYLIGKGLSPSEVTSWTVGTCSHQVRAASCYAMLERTSSPKVDPFAVSYLTGKGLTPSEVKSWTVGACSQAIKTDSCYAMLNRTAAAAPTQVVRSIGFQWGDAGIGAGFALGIVLLLGGAGAGLLLSRQNRRHQAARA
jgi:hypothetical protein